MEDAMLVPRKLRSNTGCPLIIRSISDDDDVVASQTGRDRRRQRPCQRGFGQLWLPGTIASRDHQVIGQKRGGNGRRATTTAMATGVGRVLSRVSRLNAKPRPRLELR